MKIKKDYSISEKIIIIALNYVKSMVVSSLILKRGIINIFRKNPKVYILIGKFLSRYEIIQAPQFPCFDKKTLNSSLSPRQMQYYEFLLGNKSNENDS